MRYIALGVIGGCGTAVGALRSLLQGDMALAALMATLAVIFWGRSVYVYRKVKNRDRAA